MKFKAIFCESFFIGVLIFCFYNLDAQRKLSQDLLEDLTKRIIILKESNQYFNAEILGVFSEKGGNYLQTEKEIARIPKSFENQKLLFNHWYNKNNTKLIIEGDVWGCYELLFSYFKHTFQFDDLTSAYIAKYISNLDYLTNSEKKEVQLIEDSVSNKVEVDHPSAGGRSGISIVRGLSGRRPTHFPSMQDDFSENAKVYVDIKVDTSGKVTDAVIARGTTTSNSPLRNIAIEKSKELIFQPSQIEMETGTILFVFVLNN